jgi:hypothetical protein
VLAQLHHFLGICAAAGFEGLRGAWQQRNAFADLPVRILGEAEPLAGICAGWTPTAPAAADAGRPAPGAVRRRVPEDG